MGTISYLITNIVRNIIVMFHRRTPTGLVQLQGLIIHVEYILRNRNYVAIDPEIWGAIHFRVQAWCVGTYFFPLVESMVTPYNSLAPPTVQNFTYILADNLWTE